MAHRKSGSERRRDKLAVDRLTVNAMRQGYGPGEALRLAREAVYGKRNPREVFVSSVVPEHKGLMTATVSAYSLQRAGGGHIRKATQVVINGYRIRFMEKMSVKEAVKQAVSHIRPSDNHLWEKVSG